MNSRILPLLSIVFAIGIFFAYVNPLWTGPIKETRAAIADNKQALESAAEYVKRQNELAAEMSAIDQGALARLETFLPDSVDNVGLILEMNALAERSGLALESIDVANSRAITRESTDATGLASEGPIGEIDLKLSAQGTYDALQQFLAGIESSARLLDARDITVSGSDTGVYGYQMTVRIYWLR